MSKSMTASELIAEKENRLKQRLDEQIGAIIYDVKSAYPSSVIYRNKRSQGSKNEYVSYGQPKFEFLSEKPEAVIKLKELGYSVDLVNEVERGFFNDTTIYAYRVCVAEGV
jgi:hypothetical protein